MANSFAKKIDVFFDDVVAGFDATNISSKNVSQYKAPAEALALNGQTFHRPMPLMTEIVDGRLPSPRWFRRRLTTTTSTVIRLPSPRWFRRKPLLMQILALCLPSPRWFRRMLFL